MKRTAVFLIAFTVLLQSCCQYLDQKQLQDLQNLPQDPVHYLDKDDSKSLLIDKNTHKSLTQSFLQAHFAPWHTSEPLYRARDVFWGIETFADKNLFGPNLQPRSEHWWQKLVANCQVQSYPSIHKRAITVRPTDIRVMPSQEPAFYDYQKPGEGFPFDMFQNSLLPANTPILLTHVSKDKAWFLAQTATVSGWVNTFDIARIDSQFVNKFKRHPFVVSLQDSVPIKDKNGQFRFMANLGTIFPLLDQDKANFQVALAGKNLNGSASLLTSFLPTRCSALFPLSLSPRNIAVIAGEMINQPYGWGGLYHNRDCSATIQDLFKVFGLLLPRNSSQQAKSGHVISLESKTPQEKRNLIKTKAIPFFSFLSLPGHIMLYLGMYKQQILVFHNIWGIRTWDLAHGQGRYIVGRSVITTLTPGSNLINYSHQGNLLIRLKGVTILPPSQSGF